MKKFALLLSFLAFAGNVASEGTILVNTISFADLPAKVKTSNTISAKKSAKPAPASTCVVKVKPCLAATKTVAPVSHSCPSTKTRVMIAKTMICPKVSLLN